MSDYDDEMNRRENGPMHQWFGLTYSSYLVLNRSAIQAMSVAWQKRMVALLEEMDEELDTDKLVGSFKVSPRTEKGKFAHDPYGDYRRGPRVPRRSR